jgi:hypothetical protein
MLIEKRKLLEETKLREPKGWVEGGESGLVVSVWYLLTLYYFHEAPVVSSVKAPTMIQERKRARE